MILGHDDIKRELKAGALIVGRTGEPPFDGDQVRESSLDLPIGREFYRWKKPEELERDPGMDARRIDLSHPGKELAEKLQGTSDEVHGKNPGGPGRNFHASTRRLRADPSSPIHRIT